MKRSARPFGDDILLVKRSGLGCLAGLAALLVWALGCAAFYGTDGFPMFTYLVRWSMLWPVLGGAGVMCGFAAHLLREQQNSAR